MEALKRKLLEQQTQKKLGWGDGFMIDSISSIFKMTGGLPSSPNPNSPTPFQLGDGSTDGSGSPTISLEHFSMDTLRNLQGFPDFSALTNLSNLSAAMASNPTSPGVPTTPTGTIEAENDLLSQSRKKSRIDEPTNTTSTSSSTLAPTLSITIPMVPLGNFPTTPIDSPLISTNSPFPSLSPMPDASTPTTTELLDTEIFAGKTGTGNNDVTQDSKETKNKKKRKDIDGSSGSSSDSSSDSSSSSSSSSSADAFPFALETFEPLFRLLQAKILANGHAINNITQSNLNNTLANFNTGVSSPSLISPIPGTNPSSNGTLRKSGTTGGIGTPPSFQGLTSRQLNDQLRKKMKHAISSASNGGLIGADLKDRKPKKIKRSGKEPYECPECHKVFSQKNSLTHHRRLHTGTKPYKCIECLKTFNYKGSLTKHMKSHLTINEKPFKCNTCNKTFSQKGHLKTHMYVHNGYEQVFRCPDCKKVFVHKHELNLHMRRHTGENPYKCNHCGKTFVSSFILKQHICMCTGEKPYKCTECLETFYRSSHLKQHMLTHTGEKNFKCSECDKAFTQSELLKTHMTLHALHTFSSNPPST